jgi:hypothetical protein
VTDKPLANSATARREQSAPVEERPFGISSLLWLTAYIALLLAAVLTPADQMSVVSLVGAGHVFWCTAYVLDKAFEPARSEKPGGAAIVLGVFIALGMAEAAGLAWGLYEGDLFESLWFGLAVSFAVVAAVTALRWPPSDFVLACQVFFHLVLLVPAALAAVAVMVDLGTNRGFNAGSARLLAVALFIIASVGFPFVLAATGAALQISRAANTRSWSALLVNQAAFTIMALRWVGSSL